LLFFIPAWYYTSVPKQVKQLAPLLTLFETASGCYSLRLSEVSKRATFLSIEVAKLLPDARSLQVITPNDMKVFDLASERQEAEAADASYKAFKEQELAQRNEADMPPNPFEETGPPMSMDQVVEIEAQEDQKSNGQDKRFRSPKPRLGKMAGFDEPCQRCSGTGQVQTLMEGGRPATGTCPVCQGEKQIRRFGAKR
jgi:hypothetical protein